MSDVVKVTYYGDKFLRIPGFNPAKMLANAFYIVAVDALKSTVTSYLLVGVQDSKTADTCYLNQVCSANCGGTVEGVPQYIEGKLALIQADGQGGYTSLAFTNLRRMLSELNRG